MSIEDTLVAVDGKKIQGLASSQLADLLLGPKGSACQLQLQRGPNQVVTVRLHPVLSGFGFPVFGVRSGVRFRVSVWWWLRPGLLVFPWFRVPGHELMWAVAGRCVFCQQCDPRCWALRAGFRVFG